MSTVACAPTSPNSPPPRPSSSPRFSRIDRKCGGDGRAKGAKLAIDAKRRLVYSANLQRKTITVYNADSGAILTTVPTGVAIHTIAVDQATGIVYGTQHIGKNLTILTPR